MAKNLTNIVSSLGIAVASAMMFTACQGFDEMEDDSLSTTQNIKTLSDYNANFIARYGSVDPNHTWGFEEMPAIKVQSTRANVPNRNEWKDIYHLVVPGNDCNNGDVTEDEIKYVSNWFRTHKNPEGVSIHWTDFFVQEISGEPDLDADGNWITKANRYVINENGVAEYDGQNDVHYKLDYFEALTIENGWDHIYNFNANTNEIQKESYNCRNIMYFKSSGTEDFRASDSNSLPDDPYKYQSNWVVKHLVFDVNGRHYDGYYLAFDYQLTKYENENKYVFHPADGYYSNRILKISPAGEIEMEGYPKRVMCEDLGNTGDFDFNDVVFDLYYEDMGSHTEAVVTIQAAGGTMPIYVGIDPARVNSEKYEAHHLLGQNSAKTPINVGSTSGEKAIYRLKVTSTKPQDIPIYVVNGANQVANITNIQYYNNGEAKSCAPQKLCVPNSVRWMKECQLVDCCYEHFEDWVRDEHCAYSETEAKCHAPQWEGAWFHNRNLNQNNSATLLIQSSNGYSSNEGFECWEETDNNTQPSLPQIIDPETGESQPSEKPSAGTDENNGTTANYGTKFTGNITDGVIIPAKYFSGATNKIVITFVMPTGSSLNGNLKRIYADDWSDAIEWGYIDSSAGGVFQKEITATAGLFKVAKSNGIAWRNYGTLPSEIYISYE